MAAALGVGLYCLSSHPPALAAGPDDLEQVKSQLAELRQSYEARLQALEKRIAELQQAASAPTNAAATAGASPPAPAAAGQPGAANADPSAAAHAAPPVAAATPTSPRPRRFNPAISLILAGRYASLSRDPDTYKLQGFVPTGGEVGPGPRGFSLGESELGISASIDPTFSGQLTTSFAADNSLGVEEAWFRARGWSRAGSCAPGAFSPASATSTSTMPTPGTSSTRRSSTRPFFGGPIKTDGVQMRWVAPTDRFFELGAEIGSGTSFPGSSGGRNGIGSATLFAHVGDDIGTSASWRVGVSLLGHRADDRRYDDVNGAGSPGHQQLQRTHPDLGRRRHLQVGARRQRAPAQLRPAGRVLPAARERHARLRHARRGGRDVER
jgi:hypothetical protein